VLAASKTTTTLTPLTGATKQSDQNGCLNGAAATRQPAGLDAGQAARSLYPSIARPLQKYLRLTKQTGRHNLQSIYEHLSKCLLYRLSARAFLEKFTSFDPVWQQNETNLFAGCRLFGPVGLHNKQAERELQLNSWSLICDTLLSRQIDSGKLRHTGCHPLILLSRGRHNVVPATQ
jgi:hypothetical protein